MTSAAVQCPRATRAVRQSGSARSSGLRMPMRAAWLVASGALALSGCALSDTDAASAALVGATDDLSPTLWLGPSNLPPDGEPERASAVVARWPTRTCLRFETVVLGPC